MYILLTRILNVTFNPQLVLFYRLLPIASNPVKDKYYYTANHTNIFSFLPCQ